MDNCIFSDIDEYCVCRVIVYYVTLTFNRIQIKVSLIKNKYDIDKNIDNIHVRYSPTCIC